MPRYSFKIMTCSTFSPELLDAELSLSELESMSGGVGPAAVILVGFLAAAAYGAYKYNKEMDKVPQNGDFPSESDDKNKLSYCGDVKKQEDPFGGTFTGKAN